MDDDLDLPDEGGDGSNAGRPAGSSFVSDLFGSGSRRQASATGRSTFDDILAGAPRRRQQVTFQDEQPSAAESAPKDTQQQQPSASSSLLDSLFPSGPGGSDRRTARSSGGAGTASSTGRVASPPRPQSRESGRAPSSQPTIVSNPQPMASRAAAPAVEQQSASSSVSALLQSEVEQMRREVSTLRYERAEDQRAMGELRRRLEQEQEEHKREVERGREEARQEVQELTRRHERELEEIRREADRSAQLLNSIREQQGAFDTLTTRLEALNFGLTQVRDLVQSVGTKGEELEHGWREQQGEHWKRLDAERERWEKAVREMEQEMGRLSEAYTKEIVEGRRWLEEQQEHLHAERRAFQEEQTLLLDWIEKAKSQLEDEKAEFLRREHDLLVRVLNERSLLEQERREFRRQRDTDVLRLREEAEHLEQSLAQVESAKQALDRARGDFERRSAQLNQLRDALARYEQLATQLVRSRQKK